MANQLFNTLKGNAPAKSGMPHFVQFMNQMKGKNPRDIINQMVSSGKISQNQLDQIQQQANGIMSQFDGFKNMFGF